MKPICECGRPAIVLPTIRKKSGRATRARRPHVVKNHPLCMQCFRRQADSARASELPEREVHEIEFDIALAEC